MTVRAKTLVKDKFWIVEQNGQKLGTLQKQEDNGWIFLSKQDKNQRQVFHTQESLFSKFGFNWSFVLVPRKCDHLWTVCFSPTLFEADYVVTCTELAF